MGQEKYYQHFPMITVAILVINVLVFVVLELLMSQDASAVVYSKGVMYWMTVVKEGQYYRLITSMFLHFGSSHLVNNMLILFLIGSRLEDVIGHIRFVVIYFVTGILAGIASMGYNILHNRLVVSAGASGAVFGIIGSMFWVVVANRGKVEGLTVPQMFLFVALSLYGGFADQQTDNMAHLGGLVVGILLTMVIYRSQHREK